MALGISKGTVEWPRPQVELVRIEADRVTRCVLEHLIVALEKQGFGIVRKERE
jgi:hypothetical protein